MGAGPGLLRRAAAALRAGRAGSLRGARVALLACALLSGLLPAATLAQVPPDTLRRDTVLVPIPPETVDADTLPSDSLQSMLRDSLAAAAVLPDFPRPAATGFAFGSWEFDRDELARLRGLSLHTLLERLPGFTAIRAGGFGRPIGLTAAGLGGARLRVFRDGFEVDPLYGATPDLQEIGLMDVERVRVERTPAEVRVELTTFRLPDGRPYSEVEIGAGNYETKLLRAMLTRTVGSRSVLLGSYDLVTTGGATVAEPFQFGGGRLSWSYALRPGTVLQLDASTHGTEREGEFFPLDFSRREVVARARATPLPGLMVDVAAGRSWLVPGSDSVDATAGGEATVDTVRPELASTQLMARAAYALAAGAVEGGVRLRLGGARGVPSPDTELFGRAVLRPLPLLTLQGDATAATVDGTRSTSLSATAAAGPLLGFTGFATLGAGDRWFATVRDTLVSVTDTLEDGGTRTRRFLRPEYGTGSGPATGLRAGVEWAGRGVAAGAALLTRAGGTIAPFGLAFDRPALPAEAESARGLEAHLSLPVPGTRGALRLQGSYQHWLELGGRPYLPERQGWGGVELHGLYYDGQLEPTLRVEAEYRGAALVPGPATAGPPLLAGAATEPYSLVNLYLQIRIMELRAFLFWENVLNNQAAADLDQLFQPGPRLVYGGRWYFRN